MRRVLNGLWVALAILLAAPAWAEPPETPFGRYFALVIGNNDYRDLPKLNTAVADAEAVGELLRARYQFEVRLLRNATRRDILRALNQFRAELTEEDSLLIYYAGHGYLDRQTDTGFWQPVDAEAEDDLNWIANTDLTRRLNAMSARHVLVIADSCYSGTLVRSSTGKIPTGHERAAWLERMTEKRSRTAIVSGGLEPVADSGRDGHSVFAAALLDALEQNQDFIEGSALFQKISRPVVVNAEQTPQYSDIRKAGHEGGEFIFVPAGAKAVAEAPAKPAPASAPGSATRGAGGGDKAMELAFWQAVQASDNAADLEAYLAQYPNGAFAPLAKSRLARLKSAAAPGADLAGRWTSEVLSDPWNKGHEYRLHLDFRVMGASLLGSLTRRSTVDSKRRYPPTTRPLSEGAVEGPSIRFAEAFEVLMGSRREQHKRQFTGQRQGDVIVLFQQDTLGNPPREFRLTREKKNDG